jgi:hypothetical protein
MPHAIKPQWSYCLQYDIRFYFEGGIVVHSLTRRSESVLPPKADIQGVSS